MSGNNATSSRGPLRYEIPTLEDAEGFTHWHFCMKMVLQDNDLLAVTDGTLPRPNATTDAAGYESWNAKDLKARIQIATTLRKGPLNLIMQSTSAKDCWDKLIARYQGKGGRRVAYLMESFFRTPLNDSEPMEPQIQKLIEADQNLQTIGCGVNDKNLAYIIIMALPDSLSTLQTILYNKDDQTITSEEVIALILADEERRIHSSGGTATAYYAKAGKRPNGKSKGKDKDKDKKRCTYCTFRGHEAQECRKKKKDEEEKAASKAASSGSKSSTSGGSSGSSGTSGTSTAKANVAIAKNDVIRILDSDPEPDDDETEIHCALASRVGNDSDTADKWILDSGATRTMCSNRHWFHTFTRLPRPINVFLGDDYAIPATGQGRILIASDTGNKKHWVLEDVLYVPKIKRNLLSVPQFMRRGAELRFAGEKCSIVNRQGETTCTGRLHGDMLVMDMTVVTEEHANIAVVDAFPSEGDEAPVAALTARTTSTADLTTWHRRLGHLNADAVSQMTNRDMVTGMAITRGSTLHTPCEPCVKGKQTRAEIRKTTETRADTVLGRIFTDVCGPLHPNYNGYRYFVTWVDDKSRKVYINGLKAKSEVADCLKRFVARAEVETGQRVQALRSDGGGEYIGGETQQFLRDKGIKHEMTTPDTPQHNGVAERMNRTLLDKVRTMLIDAQLPEQYWYDAIRYAVHIHNVTPTRALVDMTPEEAWSGNKPDISNLRIFGSRAFMHIPAAQRDKLSTRSLICTFIGFASQRKAYRLIHRKTRKFFESRDVIFDEGGTSSPERITFEHNVPDSSPQLQLHPQILPIQPPVPPAPPEDAPAPTVTVTRPKRNVRAPIRDDDSRYSVSSYGSRSRTAEQANVARIDMSQDPKTYAEAMARPDADKWELACEDELRSFHNMDVYELVPRPRDRKVIGSKWVLRRKFGPDGSIQKYKARIVAQGFTQIEGVDYDETFAPVAKLSSLRTILAIAAEYDLEVHQMDVKCAYLNGELEQEIFMEPPPGFDAPSNMVFRLRKAVYGTKQGGRVWYKNVKKELESMGYTRTEADHAVFVRFRDGLVSIIVVYVDDFTMVCKDIKVIMDDKEALMKAYDMTDLGEIAYILGIHVKRDRKAGRIELSQQRYVEDILERFGKTDVRPISTPALANEHLNKLESPEVDVKSYQRALGALMYPMLCTRPDLAYAIGALGRHAATPGEDHQRALDRVFRYLKWTKDWSLVYQRGSASGHILAGYADADWANDLSDRSSTSGYVFKLSGGAISWSSKKQKSIAQSSAEAEYIAGAHAAKEVIWLRRLLSEIGFPDHDATTILMDSQSAMAIAKNPQYHDRMKHIDVKYHFLRRKIEEEEIELEYVPTGEQVADTLTKGLNREKHFKFAKEMAVGCST